MTALRRCSAAAALVVAAVAAQDAPDPSEIARLSIGQLMKQPYSTQFWSWAYGPAICMSAAYEVAKDMGQNWTRALDTRLDEWLANTTSPAWAFLNNETLPWNDAVGDTNGLMPIAYLSRLDYFNEPPSPDTPDWALATAVANKWVLAWPKRLPDGIFSRDGGWTGQPDINASFLWSDDQFMGLTLVARLAAHNATNASGLLTQAATMQLDYAGYMQDPASGLFYHGFNHATMETSCCFWGRANGWVAMAHVEVLQAMQAVDPANPLFDRLMALYKSHIDGLVTVQSADGRWHQLVNETSTFLETSATAMITFALSTGVNNGWLDRATYDAAIQKGWAALAGQVQPDGTVNGICAGTGIMTSVADYNSRPTDYNSSQPGLGSVFRAARAYFHYTNNA